MARSDWHEIVPGLIWRKSQDINKVREVIKRKNDLLRFRHIGAG